MRDRTRSGHLPGLAHLQPLLGREFHLRARPTIFRRSTRSLAFRTAWRGCASRRRRYRGKRAASASGARRQRVSASAVGAPFTRTAHGGRPPLRHRRASPQWGARAGWRDVVASLQWRGRRRMRARLKSSRLGRATWLLARRRRRCPRRSGDRPRVWTSPSSRMPGKRAASRRCIHPRRRSGMSRQRGVRGSELCGSRAGSQRLRRRRNHGLRRQADRRRNRRSRDRLRSFWRGGWVDWGRLRGFGSFRCWRAKVGGFGRSGGRGDLGSRGGLGSRGAFCQALNLIDHRGVEACERARLNVEPPLLNTFKQFRALEAQFFGQFMHSRGQRQLLL